MNFGDFLEYAEALIRRDFGRGPLESFDATHVFYMGDDESIEGAAREVWEDLKEDMRGGVPLPFRDMACVSRVFHKERGRYGYILDRIVDLPFDREAERKAGIALPDWASPGIRELAARGPVQKLAVLRVEEFDRIVVPWIVFFYGTADRHILLSASPSVLMAERTGILRFEGSALEHFHAQSQAVIKQAAMISHPTNYVVEVHPELTPREARRAAAGKRTSVKKRPHYIVVDHDGLHELRRESQGGTHGSPVPHHRRGHWMRLAERCRLARESGRERVWVRPTFVGEPEFSVESNRYIVRFDVGRLGMKEEPCLR
jgi:hypothetical protein